MKLEDYEDILHTNLLPIMGLLAGPDCVFQQDGGIHPYLQINENVVYAKQYHGIRLAST